MTFIQIELDDSRTSYRPGDVVSGRVLWDLTQADPPESAEVRLVWFTRGRGDQDSGIATAEQLSDLQTVDRRVFRLTLPAGPYSMSGKLVSIVWAVEAVLEPHSRAARTEIVVSPTGREILLHQDSPDSPATASPAEPSGFPDEAGEELSEGEFWGSDP